MMMTMVTRRIIIIIIMITIMPHQVLGGLDEANTRYHRRHRAQLAPHLVEESHTPRQETNKNGHDEEPNKNVKRSGTRPAAPSHLYRVPYRPKCLHHILSVRYCHRLLVYRTQSFLHTNSG
jgi:hypothetical protein